jgi:hypothetical protein
MRCSSGKKIKLFTACNEAYLDYARALEKSVEINWGMPITVYLVDFDAEVDKSNYIPLKFYLNAGMIGKYTIEQTFCMQFRALFFPSLLNAHTLLDRNETILFWIDADSIVRKPIDSLLEHVSDCRVTAKQKGENEYASGVLGISTAEKDFAARYRELVVKDTHWKSDQRNLAEAIKIEKDNISFKPLPETFCDTTFADDSVIWTAKIKCHNDPRWLKEYEYYLSR